MTPILVLGAGHMGGALIEGWLATGAFEASDLIISDPQPGEAAAAAVRAGARLVTPGEAFAEARTVVLSVRPQIWREAAAEAAPYLASDALVVSVAAGVRTADLAAAFAPRAVARTMPTTGVAVGKGAVSIYSAHDDARAAAHALFDRVATTVDLADEALMDAAVAVSGSAPAYLYAFMEALAAAGVTQGLSPDASKALVRATMVGAAALLDRSGEDPADLRRKVASPGGTTEAALRVLIGDGGLGPLLQATVDAAARRSQELG
ncbi:MAG TPA: pyrroline-5-carboxylate reductase [Caulobacteraceae bacterium]|jgi:pyrroline-5-carboxylate reductase|nr:pyrroline-5-carboxylate reductase [Caulobacteraceae bacterium]